MSTFTYTVPVFTIERGQVKKKELIVRAEDHYQATQKAECILKARNVNQPRD